MTPLPHHNLPILLLMLALAAMFFFSFGQPDVSTWLVWMHNLNEYGIVEGYRLNNHDYPPFMSIMVLAFTSLAEQAGLYPILGFKLMLSIFLAVTTQQVYRLLQAEILPTMLFYFFLLYSSLCLGYIDICIAPCILLFFHCLQQRKTSAAVFAFTLACLLKFSPLIIAPFIAIYLVSTVVLTGKGLLAYDAGSLQRFAREVILPPLLLLVPLFIIFGSSPLRAFAVGATHTYLSANALNFNWITTRLIQLFMENRDFFVAWQDSAMFTATPPAWAVLLAKLLFVFFYLGSVIAFMKRDKTVETLLLFSLLGYFSYFMFNTGVHENHLFIACLLGMVLTGINREYLTLAVTLCFISALNLFVFNGYTGELPQLWPQWYVRDCISSPAHPCAPPIDFRLLIAICNTIYFLHLWFHIILNRGSRS